MTDTTETFKFDIVVEKRDDNEWTYLVTALDFVGHSYHPPTFTTADKALEAAEQYAKYLKANFLRQRELASERIQKTLTL